MRAWSFLVLGLAAAACGGVTNTDLHGSGGSGGSGGSAGSAGAGGSSGSAAGGGTGGVNTGGSGAIGGSGGGTAGSGGLPPMCCSDDYDCPQYFEGDESGAPEPLSTECVNGVCKEVPPPGKCWHDGDCPSGSCQGGSVCPCGADCFAEDTLGWCEGPPPPTPYCCKTDWDCGDFAYVPCVNGVCKQTVYGACWKDDECPVGQKCIGASVCPCGAACDSEDKPGKCG